ncbi:ASCH domain-containing protein [Lentilactobacillus kisonensis]|uniref:ASCH domain protein n=2 Tax=Lentilactobacillus kisonensis TaxID=481722 RepID=H1LHM9_9LACO|nr:ASCH domain-containing protein [Lentilactobacillus kisonensis]EHO50269.1 ASCH domain protein [Lentilactobacillus kisonensis F0435]KRL20068.1 ASCH domain protein [Lentilactobacillus kisonensis DSM 19906 = JCM 15041]
MDNQIKAYWQKFLSKHHLVNQEYDAWAFGDDSAMADKLADLVERRIKTATTSALDTYESDEPLPRIGDYNIILNSKGIPVCVTQTKAVEVLPFKWVSAEHAFHEGEGDRTLTYWRGVHESFFKTQYAALGKKFSEDIPCVCEVFEVVD